MVAHAPYTLYRLWHHIYTYSIQVIKVLRPFYDSRNGCAIGKGMAIVGCTVIHGGPMSVRVASAITINTS